MSGSFSLFGFPEQTRHKWLPYALLLSVTLSLYSASLYFNFVWDDFAYIHRDFRIQSLAWNYVSSVWESTYLGHYAPVHNTALALLYHFFKLEPFGYHLAQVLLHGACLCLVYLLVEKLESPRVALLASLLFAVHSTDVETVAWIAETKSTLAVLFFLLSFWFYVRLREGDRWIYGVVAGFFLVVSILSKITTVVAPAIFLLYDYKRHTPIGRVRWKSLAVYFLISVFFAFVHIASFHKSAESLERSYSGGVLVDWQNLPFLIWFYVRTALFPYSISAAETIRIYSRFDGSVLLAWIALGAAFWLLSRANRDIQFWAFWFLILLATVLQIVPNTIWVADRYLYGPLVGIAVLVSMGFFQVADRLQGAGRRLAWESAMAGVLIVLSWQTLDHLPIWRNNLTLWEGTIQTCPQVSYCHVSLGLALMGEGDLQRGGDELVRAVQMEPSPENLLNLGDALTESARNFPEAVRVYTLALNGADDPRHRSDRSIIVALHAKVARAYLGMGDLTHTEEALTAGKGVDPTNLNLRIVEAFLLWKQGNLQESRRVLASVLAAVGPTAQTVDFINFYWGNRTEVQQMLSDLRSAPRPA